jgi:hypothetical protein
MFDPFSTVRTSLHEVSFRAAVAGGMMMNVTKTKYSREQEQPHKIKVVSRPIKLPWPWIQPSRAGFNRLSKRKKQKMRKVMYPFERMPRFVCTSSGSVRPLLEYADVRLAGAVAAGQYNNIPIPY